MIILAIETSTLTGSVALTAEGRLLGEVTLSVSVQHSERLMPAIERLLGDASLKPSDIDLYAVAVGPGSFTGLRIGIAAAQGLALARGRPVVGVSTLQGLAMNAVSFPGTIVPVLNAFRGEVFFGLYRAKEGVPLAQAEEGVVPVDEFLSRLEGLSGEKIFLGNGCSLLKGIAAAPEPLHHPRASHIAYLAAREATVEGMALPRYLRKPG